MGCNKTTNLKKGWNHYCSFINLLPFIKNDTVFGVYLGCECKKHDIYYSNEGTINSRKIVDYLFLKKVYKKHRIVGKTKIYSAIISLIMWIGIRIGGIFVWKTWSSKWADRYQ